MAQPEYVRFVDCRGARASFSAVSMLLADARDALDAYERLARLDDPGHVSPAVEGVASSGSMPASIDAAGAAALVLGISPDVECEDTGTTAAIIRVAKSHTASLNVYAILTCDDSELDAARATLQTIASSCSDEGTAWCGALVISDAAMLARLTHAPRMGFWRRAVSESVDELVLAIRCGTSLANTSTSGATAAFASARRPPWLR